MSNKKECPACVASRRSVVESFFLGIRAGHRLAVSSMAAESLAPPAEEPYFCLAHDKMLTEAYASDLREIFDFFKGT